MVRSSEIPYLADWFAITYRWLVLMALAISMALLGRLDGWMFAALSLPAAWNLVMSVLAVFNRRLNYHRLINVAVDTLCALIIFMLSGDIRGPVLWVGILTIAPASIYFELRGSLASALIISLLETAYLYLAQPALIAPTPLVALVGLNLGVGLGMGLLSRPLIRRLRQTYHGLVRNRRDIEMRIQMRERERMKALSDMIATFSATLNYKTVLEAAMNSSISTMGLSEEEAGPLLCAFLLFEAPGLVYVVGRGFPARDQAVPLPAEEGLLAEVLHTGEHRLVVNEKCDDPELCKLIALHVCRSVLVMPLVRGMNAYGVLVYAHPAPAFFTPDRTDLLLTIGNQAVIAIQNARLFQDLAAEKERLVQTQEEAQKKLARDLHDGPTQSVSSIAMRLSIVRRMLERNPNSAADELAQIEDLARRTTDEIRHMLFTLRPLVLESEGLVAALNAMSVKMRTLYQQNIVVDVDPAVVEALDASKQTVVFYLTEEAVNNARKHAEATQVAVRLKFIANDQSLAGLEISDNGRGFDVNEVMGNYEKRGSLGMINLRERTDMVSGLLKVDSAPGKGTRIRVYIPLNEAAMERLHGAQN
ncbi:MAG TPA: GAF domain-containing sensor histidine kinase [Anaerolinea sp.]|nr:GAF domain-containing sensor histidine kinase [Anaerolinea sp.]